AARRMLTEVVERSLASLPEGEAGLERTRILGSSAAAGLGEAVFRMEAERPVPVVERLLEHPLRGRFVMETANGSRVVELRGKADRLDLLADGTFRLIDYKLGCPPDPTPAVQPRRRIPEVLCRMRLTAWPAPTRWIPFATWSSRPPRGLGRRGCLWSATSASSRLASSRNTFSRSPSRARLPPKCASALSSACVKRAVYRGRVTRAGAISGLAWAAFPSRPSTPSAWPWSASSRSRRTSIPALSWL